jgi:type II secretory pathway pseudopilin PulG
MTQLNRIQRRRSRRVFGFSMLETIIAMGVLAAGALGSLSGIASSNKELREGQLRQYKMLLLDAKAQRRMLENKTPLLLTMITSGYPVAANALTHPTNLAIGAAPWAVDTASASVPFDANDLSTGAYFKVLPDGEVQKLTTTTVPSIATGTACNSTALPQGIYCRETMLTYGPPVPYTGPGGAIVPTNTNVMTYWTRVSRVGEPASMAVMHWEVIVQ